jgi:hypothetical protein|tara:strand:- start:3986 stop:4861 length:876 start_codon:yes stop_codon:yes gene_type:complete
LNPKDPCQCSSTGFCERYLTEVDDTTWTLCKEREDYRERFHDLSLERIKLKKERADEKVRLKSENHSSSVSAIHICNGLFEFLRSRFFKKELLHPIDVSIKGLERSGTGFIHDLLERNLLSSFVEQVEKHHFPKESSRAARRVVLCVKNPYSWYLGFRDFGHAGRPVKNGCNYSSPTECIKLWVSFYSSWLSSDHDIFLLRYEDMIGDEPSWIKNIARHFGVRNTESYFGVKSYVNNYVNRPTTSWSSDFNRKEYFLSRSYVNDLSDEHIIDIYNALDVKLLKKLGYSREP